LENTIKVSLPSSEEDGKYTLMAFYFLKSPFYKDL